MNETLYAVSRINLDFAKYGVKNEDIKQDTIDSQPQVTFFVTVPNKSHLKLDSGEEAIGEALAKFIKEKIHDYQEEEIRSIVTNMGITIDSYIDKSIRAHHGSNIKIKYKVREEEWTLEKEQESTLRAMVVISLAAKEIQKKQ